MTEFNTHEHRLTLSEILELMVGDGLTDQATADALKTERRLHSAKVHPLIVIADQKWRTTGVPIRLLSLEYLTEWLAGKVGLDYLHIDPLKID
jgi:general secretion pathway protein E